MSITFRDYLIAEAAGVDPQEMGNNQMDAPQDHVVDLTSEIRKIMQNMDSLSSTEDGEELHAYTFIDLLEALTTTEEVISSRLNSDGAHVDDHRGGTRHVQADGREWQGDEEKGFERLFNSIGEEAKDAVRNIFAGVPDENEKVKSPRFVQAFNSLIINRLVEGMKGMGIEQAKQALPGIMHAAKQAVVQNQQNLGNMSATDLQQLVRKFGIARNQTVGKRSAGARNRHERSRMSQAMS